jgi:riboflavin biosynthesis pyrimidine reductase
MSDADQASLPALELLFERPDLPTSGLPEALVRAYAGELGVNGPRVFANFVASLDGVVALPGPAESGHVISQDSEADRFVMGLLRACADAVVIGAGTFRRSPAHLWQAGSIYPPATELFAQVRAQLGLQPQPKLVVVSASGALDVARPALADAVIVTSVSGASKLRPVLPPEARLVVLDLQNLRLSEVIARLQSEGLPRLLTEGGPSLFARLVSEQLVDELFLTTSPALFGRLANDQRKSLTDGLDLAGTQLDLLSARRHGSHLFLRYALRRMRIPSLVP